jgi:hypothetical protein
VVHHRNHLGVMSASPLTFSKDASTVANFEDPSFPLHGNEGMRTEGTVRTQWPGDVLRDGLIIYTGASNDRDPILVQIGGSVPTNVVSAYAQADVTMDGSISYTGSGNDRDPVLLSIGGSVPTAVRAEQVP